MRTGMILLASSWNTASRHQHHQQTTNNKQQTTNNETNKKGRNQSMTERASGLTLRQERALAICPKISAAISIPCSCFIIYDIWLEHKRNKSTAVQRALLAMSTVDILASSAWFLSTWAAPASTGFAFAAGTRATCNLQGFLLQLAIGAPLYNSSLALFYLLMIKMRWTDKDLLYIERFVHFFVGTFTLGTSLLLLPLHQYNHIGAVSCCVTITLYICLYSPAGLISFFSPSFLRSAG